MKLFEIISTAFQVKKGWTRQNSGGKEIGSGSFSQVLTHEDPHLVTKNSAMATALNDDPYFQYVQRIVEDNLAAENPYFPRIYRITVHASKIVRDAEAFYDVDMEKLIRCDDPDITYEEKWLLLTRIVGEEEAEEIGVPPSNQYGNFGVVKDVMKDYIYDKQGAGYIKDKKLVECLDVVKEICGSNPVFRYDIRVPNMMLRRTSVGLQLVLTDPLFNKEL